MSSDPSPFLSVALISLVGLMVLVPPLAFLRAFARLGASLGSQWGYGVRAVWLLVGLVPFAVNLGYMSLAIGDLRAGHLVLDQSLAVAVLVAWGSFWARVAIGRRSFKRKRRHHISVQ